MNLADPSTAPVGGAALDQVIGLTVGAGIVTAVLLLIAWQHRTHRIDWYERLGEAAGRTFGWTPWASLANIFVSATLVTALLGFLWDVSIHAGRGRDAGPLANPAHYFILFGLFFLFIAGMSAVVYPRDGAKPSPSSVRITGSWYAPVSGIYLAGCGLYALIGFPLDDVWHRLFGQDVTLWGPTHLMLITGAGMSTIGIILLLREAEFSSHEAAEATPKWLRVGAMSIAFGAVVIGLSVYQAEFDFAVAQFRMVFQPMLIALAAAFPFVAARLFLGPGAALLAGAMFLGTRGVVSFIVTNVFGMEKHVFPLYIGSAIIIELLGALPLVRRPLWFGAVGGFLIGTLGMVIEAIWVDRVFAFPWTQDIWAEGLAMTVPVAIGSGMCGALFVLGLKGRLGAPAGAGRISRGLAAAVVIGTLVVIAGATASGLNATVPKNATATVDTQQVGMPGKPEIIAKVKVSPANLIDDHPTYVAMLSWQGGGEGVITDRLRRTGPDTWESTRPVPAYGNWKTLLRVQDGRMLTAVPIYMARDRALGAPELPASKHFTRAFVPEIKILQRERSFDAPAWLWGAANIVVLICTLGVILGLAMATSRISAGVEEAQKQGVTLSNL
ncbi:MAG TPA: hypothetical protein VM093_08605 [Aeromicrobium sp.]|nr:hypothetical protein [Aeromicrobium sp.]